MNIPTTSSVLEKETNYLPPSRRRRNNRGLFPVGKDGISEGLDEIIRKTCPTFDYLVSTFVSGVILIPALLLDSLPLFFLACLCASFMAPVMNLPATLLRGSLSLFIRSAGGIGLGGMIIFVCGILAGVIQWFIPSIEHNSLLLAPIFSWLDLFLVIIGSALTLLLIVRASKPRQLTISSVLSFELYIPLAASGYGVVTGTVGLWPEGLYVYAQYLAAATLTGIVILIMTGFKPVAFGGYFSTLAGFSLVVGFSIPLMGKISLPDFNFQLVPVRQAMVSLPAEPESQATPNEITWHTATATGTPLPPKPKPTSTITLQPSPTPTITDTPMPTPVWAKVHAGERGAVIREAASGYSNIIKFIDNNALVQLMPETILKEGVIWTRVRLMDGKEGWMLRNLLITATPIAGR